MNNICVRGEPKGIVPEEDVTRLVVHGANKLINAKKDAPGSEYHDQTLGDLLSVLTNKPGAIDALAELQNGQ